MSPPCVCQNPLGSDLDTYWGGCGIGYDDGDGDGGGDDDGEEAEAEEEKEKEKDEEEAEAAEAKAEAEEQPPPPLPLLPSISPPSLPSIPPPKKSQNQKIPKNPPPPKKRPYVGRKGKGRTVQYSKTLPPPGVFSSAFLPLFSLFSFRPCPFSSLLFSSLLPFFLHIHIHIHPPPSPPKLKSFPPFLENLRKRRKSIRHKTHHKTQHITTPFPCPFPSLSHKKKGKQHLKLSFRIQIQV